MTESTTTHRPSSHSKQSQGGRSHPPRGHTSTSGGGGVKSGNNKKTKKGKKGQKLDPFMLGFSVHAAERPNIGEIQSDNILTVNSLTELLQLYLYVYQFV